MTIEEYAYQNAKGFEGDELLAKMFQRVIKENKITKIIETGTYKGATTSRLADMVKKVITIESNIGYKIEITKALKEKKNVNVYYGDSINNLSLAIGDFGEGGLMFFLDAHWKGSPLLAELRIIKENNLRPVIAIHDFKVPNHTELGYDSYFGQDYEWDWIKDSIELIYKGNYKIEYNNKAEGAKRGCIFITPC